MDKITQTIEKAKQDQVRLIDLQFTDFFGAIKVVTIPADKLEDALRAGIWFDGSSIQGFARIYESDMFLAPDTDTYAVLPWTKDTNAPTARLICDVHNADGEPFDGCPRTILKRVLKEAEELGYSYNTGPELEFFLFPKDEDGIPIVESKGNSAYFTLPLDETYDIRRDIVEALIEFGIEPEMSHPEVAWNQHEIDFKYGGALKTADNAISFKTVVKSIANQYGYYATFMPKPIFGVNGSGMHVHQSLFKGSDNVFYDPSDAYKLSPVAKSFIAGQLKYIKEIAAITSPTVNSYKRLTPGYEAPVYICWAQRNRSAMIRIPRFTPGREKAVRAELRCPDPSSNPYLCFAAILKAGIKGIKENLTPPAAMEEDVFEFGEEERKLKGVDSLPGSKGEAIQEMERGSIAKEIFKGAYNDFVSVHKAEWDKYRIQVSDWELDYYLEQL
ncbi:MAG: glutamine synthetase family protein [bacterium]